MTPISQVVNAVLSRREQLDLLCAATMSPASAVDQFTHWHSDQLNRGHNSAPDLLHPVVVCQLPCTSYTRRWWHRTAWRRPYTICNVEFMPRVRSVCRTYTVCAHDTTTFWTCWLLDIVTQCRAWNVDCHVSVTQCRAWNVDCHVNVTVSESSNGCWRHSCSVTTALCDILVKSAVYK